MPIYELEVNGKQYELDAPDEQSAISAVSSYSQPDEQPQPVEEKKGAISNLLDVFHAPGFIRKPIEESPYLPLADIGYTEIASPVSSGISNALFGLPKFLATKAGAEKAIFPEQTTLPGKTLRFGSEIAGLTQGLGAKAGTAIASKLFPALKASEMGVGLGSKVGEIQKVKNMQRGLAIGRGAVEGGVIGATSLDSDSTIEKQAGKGVLGAGLGAVVPFTRSFFSKVSPKIKLAGKEKYYKEKTGINIKLEKDPTKRVSQLNEQLNNVYRQKGQKLSEDLMKQTAQSKLNFSNDFLSKENNVIGKIKQVKDSAFEMATESTGNIQQSLNPMGKQLSTIYDDVIDKLPEDIKISGAAAKEIFRKTGEEMAEIGIEGSQYVFDSVVNSIGKEVGIKELVQKYQSLNAQLSSSAKNIGRYTKSDVPLVGLKKKILEVLEKNGITEFKQLNKEYGEAANTIYSAMKTFKPAKRELGTKQGEGLLYRIFKNTAKGNPVPSQDKALLQNLEQGFKVMGFDIKGIEPVLKRLEDKGMDMKALSDSLKKLKTDKESQKIFMDIYNKNKETAAKEALKMSKFAKESRLENIKTTFGLNKMLYNKTLGLAERAAEATLIAYIIRSGLRTFEGH